MNKIAHHELGTARNSIETASDRSFGLVFAVAFALLSGYLAWHGKSWWPALLAPAAMFVIVALTRPALLAPLNRVWTKVGLLLGAVVAPIMMGAVYFMVITPMGLVARAMGKDFLRRRRDATVSTYWLSRSSREPTRENLRDQF